MGCGFSTSNLPNYMRGGRNPASRKPGQLGWHDDDYDDHKVAIIDRRNIDSNAVDLHDDDSPIHDQRITVSSPHAKPQPNFDKGNGQRISVSSPHAMTRPNFDMGNGRLRINVPSPHMGNGREHDARNDNEKTAEGNDADESEDDGSHIGNSSWIGSPSFRDYCGNPRDSVDSDISQSDGESKETKTQGGLHHASPKPNEGLDSSDRRRRGSRFRKVFPAARRSSAMKNIINVATCYNPNHATSRVGQGN